MIETLWLHGLDVPSLSSLLLRFILGAFFLLARFRWLYDPSRPEHPWLNPGRHLHLAWKICTCGYGLHPRIATFVALTEILAGVMLILGLASMLAATALLVVLCFATVCNATEKVAEQNPVDCLDCVSCYLWRVEGIYIVIALAFLALGPGQWSMDTWLLSL